MFAKSITLHRSKGQSLVETALFLPILIILLGGLVEVSNLLVTQNRVTTAARAATGFAAANYRGDDWENPDTWSTAMAKVARNNVTNTLDLDPALWDIWAIKATLDPDATSFQEWNAQHAEGTGNVVSSAEWQVMESQIMTDVLDALDPSEVGLEVVATVAFHDRQSLLGLNAFNVGELTRVRGLSVMRVDEPLPYNACDAFPIAVSLNNRSVWPADMNIEPSYNVPDGEEEYPFRSTDRYNNNNQMYDWPDHSDGADPPFYEEGNTERFPRNVPGIPITQAEPGYLFLTKQATESDTSGFGWLRWSEETRGGGNSQDALAESLQYPGNAAETYDYEPWSEDGLDQFDMVRVNTGAVTSVDVRDVMREHVATPGRTLKLIVFTPPNVRGGDWNEDGFGTNATGSNQEYEIYGFVIVKVIAWYLPGNANWLLFEYIDWSDSC